MIRGYFEGFLNVFFRVVVIESILQMHIATDGV